MSTLTIEEGLMYLLKHTAAIQALIGDRVYLNRTPQTILLPCLVLRRISGPRVLTHDTSGGAGVAYPRFQFDAFASTYATAKGVTDALRALLNGYKGTITSGANTVKIQAAWIEDERDNSDPDAGLEDLQSDYFVWHEEA